MASLNDDHDESEDALAATVQPLAERFDPVPPAVVDAAKAVFKNRTTGANPGSSPRIDDERDPQAEDRPSEEVSDLRS